jgi:AraC family transcriptional regulator, transcriptional activator FtrA
VTHRVAALALPDVVTFDLGCAIQVFGHAPNLDDTGGRYEFTVCGPRRSVRTGDGFALSVTAGLDAIADADTVIVPGYERPQSGAA